MRLAINQALKSREPLKCGTVIVKNKKVIAKAYNSQRTSHDPSAHAEIKALRRAGRRMGSKYMRGCVVYSTHEPCLMCLSALVFSEIKKLVFGIPTLEHSPKGKTIKLYIDDFLSYIPATNKFEVVKNFLKEEVRRKL